MLNFLLQPITSSIGDTATSNNLYIKENSTTPSKTNPWKMRFRIRKPQNFQVPAVSFRGCNSPDYLLQAFFWRSVRHRHVKVNLMLFAKHRIAKPTVRDPPFRLPKKNDQPNNFPAKKTLKFASTTSKATFWGWIEVHPLGAAQNDSTKHLKSPKCNSEFTPEKRMGQEDVIAFPFERRSIFRGDVVKLLGRLGFQHWMF